MTSAVRTSVPAYSIARGIGFTIAALLVELVLPLMTPRVDDAVPVDPIATLPFLSGALLRSAALVLVFSAIAWTVAESTSRAARFIATLVSAALLFAEAGSYRWLGEHGELLSFRSTLFPLVAYVGNRALIASAVALAGTVVALGIARFLEPELAERYASDKAVAVDLMLLSVALLFGSATIWLGGGSLRIGATHPVVAWFLASETPRVVVEESEPPREFDPSGVRLPPPDLLDIVATTQQLRRPDELTDSAHPYCRPDRPITRAESPRSVVLLVLRGVSVDSIHGDGPPLPSLARLAGEGASFEHAVSGNDDPTQGLVQILTGISPLAPARYHEMANVPRLPSLPATLEQLGLGTAFVSSFDLSAGRERALLHDLRFAAIDEPSFGAEAARGATAGSDEATVGDLIARLDATKSGGPRFVVAALRSGLGVAPATPLTELDRQLARFVAWFDANERSRGTVLVVTSDSAPTTTSGGSLTSRRFGVPLVFSNLRNDERNRGRARSGALVGLLDVADTILGLEGLGPTGCFQGHDLLAAREPPPRRRRLLAFGGPDQAYVYVFDGRFRWQIDRSLLEGSFRVYDTEGDPAFEHDLYDAADPATPLVREQVLAMLGLGQYLIANDRFVPGSRGDGTRAPISTTSTIQVAALATANPNSTTSSLTSRKASGFGAFVLSVGIDEATLAPIASGKPLVEVLTGLARALGDLDLALDIAMPEQSVPARSVEAARQIVSAVEASGLTGTVYLLPRDPIMATSLAARTSRPVLVRIPGGGADLAVLATSFGANGVVVAADAVTPAFVTEAHRRGLRVVIDGIASREALDAFTESKPDFAIVVTQSPIRDR